VFVDGGAREPADEAGSGQGDGKLDHGLDFDEVVGAAGLLRDVVVVCHRSNAITVGVVRETGARLTEATRYTQKVEISSGNEYRLSQFESEFEENLFAARREKLAAIAALGQQAYPNSFAFTHTLSKTAEKIPALLPLGLDAEGAPKSAEALEAEGIKAAIAGRIVAIRLQGKAGFATLLQNGARLQIYVRKDDVGEQAFELYKLLDLGDHVGVTGTLMRTRTGELTLKVQTLTFLAKAMLPLPDKYSGLGDIELRYRRRYLDLFTDTGDVAELAADAAEGTKPELLRAPAREVFVKRAAVLRSIRNFFDTRGYLEVETPMLHTIAGGAAARTFTTHHNAEDMKLTLRIAPELHLKRLVVGGLDRVYEINRNFRNEGIDRTHNPEFTMLEFYQAYANYHDLMELTQELVKQVAMDVNGTTVTRFNGVEIDLGKWTKLSMREAIKHYWEKIIPNGPTEEDFASKNSFQHVLARGVADASRLIDELDTDLDDATERYANLMAIRSAIKVIGEWLDAGMPLGKTISDFFEFLAEAHLIQPTIIYDFPLAVSPLSKVKPAEPEWTERFEFYIGGFEVGNAFSELNDPSDQLARFEAQVADKDPESMAAVDEDYVRALGYGLPPTAGEGIGIDRLTMVLTGSRTIRDVILFPLMRPVKAVPEDGEQAHGESAE
jgi:lysyl-tRNA synthetase class 2